MMHDLLPANVRRWAYVIFAILGVVFGATQTAFVTAGNVAPLWLDVAFQVYLYVGGAFGIVAATNTTKPTAKLETIEIDGISVLSYQDYDSDVMVDDIIDLEKRSPKHAAE